MGLIFDFSWKDIGVLTVIKVYPRGQIAEIHLHFNTVYLQDVYYTYIIYILYYCNFSCDYLKHVLMMYNYKTYNTPRIGPKEAKYSYEIITLISIIYSTYHYYTTTIQYNTILLYYTILQNERCYHRPIRDCDRRHRRRDQENFWDLHGNRDIWSRHNEHPAPLQTDHNHHRLQDSALRVLEE